MAVHAAPAHEDVLDGRGEGVAQMEAARDVRGRQEHGEGLGGAGGRGEEASVLPPLVPALLNISLRAR